jgi:signal transduction histidine kinase
MVSLGLLGPAAADDGHATPEEVIAKVREAAAHLAREGKPGLSTFDNADSPFVWKDTYVFVYDCPGDVIAAHPVAESRGVQISGLRGGDGAAFGIALCAAAEPPGGSWAEYQWRRTVGANSKDLAYSGDHVRKVSYMLAVEGMPYQVGAGIFDETSSLEDLDALLAN